MHIRTIRKILNEIIEKYNSKNFTRVLTYTYPDMLKEIKQLTSKYNPLNANEMVYILTNEPPSLCENGKYPKFNTFELGYRLGCGRGCLCTKKSQAEKLSGWHKSRTPEEKQTLIDNAKTTFVENYGVDNPMKVESIKQQLREDNLEKYGVEYPLQSEGIKEKIRNTMLEKYGIEYPGASHIIRQKVVNTTMNRYGGLMTHARKGAYEKYDDLNPFQSEDVKNKRSETMIETYGTIHALANKEIYDKMVSDNIEKYGRPNVMQRNIPNNTWDILNNKELFTALVKGKTSQQIKDELNLTNTGEVLKWVRRHDILDEIIFQPHSAMEHDLKIWLDSKGISYQQHNKMVLPNHLELDFYFPQWNFAIELHGLYFHSEIAGKKDKNYHSLKHKGCQIKNIQLLQIWQDEYWQHKEVVQSKILYLANMINNKIQARKCKLESLTDTNLERTFMNKNHIQGFAEYRQWSLGAWYNNELVGVMSFSNQMNRLELVRYATKIDSVASGLFSKMLKQSIREFKFTGNMISMSDNRISNGRLYLNSGFTNIEESKLGYCYTTDYVTRMNRQNAMKPKLIKRHNLDSNIANTMSEWDLAQELGYDRLWDAGKVKWQIKCDQF